MSSENQKWNSNRYVLVGVLITVMKHHNQKAIYGGKDLFVLYFQVTIYRREVSRNLWTEAETWFIVVTWEKQT